MFLLGCIFLIVEYDRSGEDVETWTRVIAKHGGEIESTYTLRVTHIICMTQKHPLVQQVIGFRLKTHDLCRVDVRLDIYQPMLNNRYNT